MQIPKSLPGKTEDDDVAAVDIDKNAKAEQPDYADSEDFADDKMLNKYSKKYKLGAKCNPPVRHALSNLEEKFAASLDTGKLFEDPDFPAAPESLYFDPSKPFEGHCCSNIMLS